MSLYHNIVAFSPKGDYLAYSSPDGCLKIWETSTSILKQEYTPSSHLSATCSSLSWGPCKQNPSSSKGSKKMKGSSSFAIDQFIAMGTMTGDVILYNFTKAGLHSCLTGGHTNFVNDLSWCMSTKSLYTCSKDQYIIVWDVISGKIRTKWKADKVAVNSICVVDENNILSASSSISWWDVKKQNLIRNFSGHAAEVIQLLPIKTDEPDTNYFLSSALGDRVISVWQLAENTKRCAVSFITNGEPENVDILVQENEPFRMSVVTKDGTFHMFEHFLNGKRKKPVLPKFSIQIASQVSVSDGSTKPLSVPILAASLSEGFDSCILMYGNWVKPVFERVNTSEISQSAVLIRDLAFSGKGPALVDSVTKIKKPERPNDVKMIAPGYMADIPKNQLRKRKKESTDNTELPMEELLKALDLSKTPKNVSEESAVKIDSMVHLLVQGLQSKDRKLLDTVLNKGSEAVICNTLERIPLSCVLSLLKELQIRMSKQESRHHPAIKWMKGLLSLHLPYLMSIKDIHEYLGPIKQVIEARVENFNKMSQLKGCLQVVMSQAAANLNAVKDWSSEPLTEYVSESSDDNEDEESASDESDSDEDRNVTPVTESDEDSESDMSET